jgi:hypothetical protein
MGAEQGVMSDAIRSQAEAYRRQAEEVRTTADNLGDAEYRESMYRLADGYDRFAENLERVAGRPYVLADSISSHAYGTKPRLIVRGGGGEQYH